MPDEWRNLQTDEFAQAARAFKTVIVFGYQQRIIGFGHGAKFFEALFGGSFLAGEDFDVVSFQPRITLVAARVTIRGIVALHVRIYQPSAGSL